MEKFLSSKLSEDEKRIQVLKLNTLKEIHLRQISRELFSPEVRNYYNKLIDELVCETILTYLMELSVSYVNPYRYFTDISISHDSLLFMTEDLNINKVNQDVDCPKCFTLVKCLWLSKHLAVCMNPDKNMYSYSSRNSSRIARQRIQEGFKTAYEDSKNDSDDEKMKPKKRNKGRKAKIKVVRAPVK